MPSLPPPPWPGRPARGGIEIAHHLCIRNLADDLCDDVVDLHVRHIALPRIEVGCDREVTELGQTAAHVLDVLVHAEDLLHHQHRRQSGLAGRLRVIARDFAVAGGNAYVAGGEALSIGRDHRACSDRLHRRRETGADRRLEESASVDAQRLLLATQVIFRFTVHIVGVHRASVHRASANQRSWRGTAIRIRANPRVVAAGLFARGQSWSVDSCLALRRR